jgi:RimJ/RimL family protein N-acetyltransferase
MHSAAGGDVPPYCCESVTPREYPALQDFSRAGQRQAGEDRCAASATLNPMASLIETQLDVLLSRNQEGRLSTTRDPIPRPAPRLFLGRSRDGNTWATRRDVDPETSSELERLCSAEQPLVNPSPEHPPACRDRVLELLGPTEFEWRGPAYVLPERLPHDNRAREVSAEESSEWLEAFPWLANDFQTLAPVIIAFEAGNPAAICHSPRGSTASAAEAGVETLEHYRSRGLATAAVACWARAVQRSRRIALYSTAWENTASRAVARRLSARLYGENWHLT